MKRYNVFRKEKKGEAITLIDTANYVSILPFSTSKINDVPWIFRPSSAYIYTEILPQIYKDYFKTMDKIVFHKIHFHK